MLRELDCDFLIVGSGFGGSVAALRLVEKGYRVIVLEQGRRVGRDDFEAARHSVRKLAFEPRLGLDGFFVQHVLPHVAIVGGVGVGGGSLVYAAVLLEPKDRFYEDPVFARLGIDMRAELAPAFERAKQMLGRAENPLLGTQDRWLEATARAMGAGSTYGPTPLGIHFGEGPDRISSDPYFDGAGPERRGCNGCGECLTGCTFGAKNSLDKNYLYLAEKRGARILVERKATAIRPLASGGYAVDSAHPLRDHETHPAIRARHVVLSAGVVGTHELLFRCREELKTLPQVSARLGRVVRTNSEAIVGILARDASEDLSKGGPAVSSHFHPDAHTHVTQNRFPPGFDFQKHYFGPMVDDPRPGRRALRTLAAIARDPAALLRPRLASDWHRRVTVLTVMQDHDNHLHFRWGRSPLHGFRNAVLSEVDPAHRAPTYLPEANRAARAFAEATNGTPQSVLFESLANLSTTAHILGGCAMARTPDEGVVDARHEVFGCPGLFVVDGSSVPANVGVNPSLTITAMAERWASLIPPSPGA